MYLYMTPYNAPGQKKPLSVKDFLKISEPQEKEY